MTRATHALFDGAQSGVVHVITPCDVPQAQTRRPLQASLSVIRRAPSRETAAETHNTYGQSEEDLESMFSVVSVCFMRIEVSSRRLQVTSSFVLMSLLLVLVWLFPVETTVLLVTLAAVVGYYEFAWLAFRIQSRVLETYRYYEGEGSKNEQRQRLATRVTGVIQRDTRAASAGVAGSRADQLQQQQIPVPELSKIYPRHCAVWLTSEKFCRGNQWIAALIIAIPLAALLMAIDVFAIERFLLTKKPTELYSSDAFYWIFLVSTRYVASVGALFCPNWEYVVLMVFEVAAFSVMTSQTLLCPMGNFECSSGRDDSATGTAIAIFASLTIATTGILLLTVLSSVDAIEIVVKSMLHLVGFALVFVLALAILTLADTVAIRASHGSLVALLSVTWAGDCSAFLWNLVRRSVRLGGQSPLAPPVRTQVDSRRDVECMLVAIGSGALVMAALTQLTVLPRGSVAAQITLAVGAIVFGRMGNLVLGIMEKAAGVRRSGRLIPGLGGVLDQTVALSLAALVFAKYVGQL